MSTSTQTSPCPVSLAGTTLPPGRRHACAFFNSRDEEYRVLLPFIKEGFERGEKGFHIVDPRLTDDHRRRLAACGIDVDGLEQGKQLETRVWSEAYLRDGHFDQERMLELIQQVLEDGRERFPLTRLIAHMEWALEDRPGVNDLVEYETRLNHVLPRYEDPVICTYDLAKFNGQVVMDILRTHPVVIVGDSVHENPFFVPPDQLLEELQQRRAGTN